MSASYCMPRLVLEERAEERRFRRIATLTLLAAALLGVLVPFIDLPEVERARKEIVPPRLAKLILEKKPPPPPQVVEAKPKPKPKPPPKPAVKAKPKPKPEPKPEPAVIKRAPPKIKEPASAREARAREKARSTGLLAMSDDLSALMDEGPAASELLKRPVTRKGAPPEAAAPKVDTAVLTAGVTQGSGGVATGKLNRDVGSTRLQARQQSKLAKGGQQGAVKKAGKRRAGRGMSEIQMVFDKNKGAIFAIYNRALRRDPDLQGKLVLRITIAPSGKVTAVKVVSSELNNRSLERKLVQRIKMFNFGRKAVDTVTVTYPIDFFPA